MHNLLKNWKDRRIPLRSIALFLDFDGTLTPIRPRPQDVVLSEHTRDILKALTRDPSISVAIVSGRPLKVLQNLVGIKNIVYVGNHGFDIKGESLPGNPLLTAEMKKVIRDMARRLKEELKHLKGIIMEDKQTTLSIHFRTASVQEVRLMRSVLARIGRKYKEEGQIRIVPGKKVYEIRPAVDWDKGQAVLWLLSCLERRYQRPFYPIYIGDDTTDEDVFRALRNSEALTIRVGQSQKSSAHYYVNTQRQVIGFLWSLLRTKREWASQWN